MESKSELTSQIWMISSERDRALCKSGELQGEKDIHIKRCDGLQTEKENLLQKAESDIANLHEYKSSLECKL